MIILGIETSCDETAVSLLKARGQKITVLANVVASQIDIHKQYGGVVPEVAARHHVLNMLPVLDQALVQAGLERSTAFKKIKTIAVTVGPGLITSLLVGLETAKTLAYAHRLPIVPVNHIAGHIYANALSQKMKFPCLALTVSGGHTMLVLMTGHGRYQTIGNTLDDAAGEALDKAAKLLGLGYPGGPAISAQAALFKKTNSTGLTFPRPLSEKDNFNFSFSGLKTALLYQVQKDPDWPHKIPEYCYQYQQAIIDSLISKTIRAAQKHKVKSVILAGGVSANQELREQFAKRLQQELPLAKLSIPELNYTTDNAAMVAAAGYFNFKQGAKTNWSQIAVDPNLNL